MGLSEEELFDPRQLTEKKDLTGLARTLNILHQKVSILYFYKI